MISFKDFISENLEEQEAWHGSPYHFDKFSRKNTAHSGEGGAAYGSGIYLTSHRAVGEYYRDTNQKSNDRTLYNVKMSVDKNRLMHWHKKVNDQSTFVQKAIRKIAPDFDWHKNPNPEARHVFHHVRTTYKNGGANNVEASESASNAFHSVGIHGIEYHGDIDQKNNERPTNHVIFDPKKISISQKYDQHGNAK